MANLKKELTKLYNTLSGESKQPHEFKNKSEIIAGISEHAQGGGGGTVDTEMSDSSTNAVQNKVIKEYVDDNTNAPFIVTLTADYNTFVADKTFGEIKAAADNNKIVIFKLDVEGTVSARIVVSYIILSGGTYAISWADGSGTIKSATGTENNHPTLTME